MVGGRFAAESPLFYLSVERGEEQVLQYRAVIRIPAIAVVAYQQFLDPLLNEQIGANKPLFLDEPDEYQARQHSDDMIFALNAAVGRELRGVQSALEPLEEFLIELLVERIGIQRVQPRLQQPVEVLRLGARGHPAPPLIQRQFAEYLDVRGVRLGKIDAAYHRRLFKHVAGGVRLALAAANERDADFVRALRLEQRHHRRPEPLVDFPREPRVVAARVRQVVAPGPKLRRRKDKAALAAVVKARRVNQGGLRLRGDFRVGYLEQDADRLRGGLEFALRFRGGIGRGRCAFGRGEFADECVRGVVRQRGRAGALIAERVEQRPSAVGQGDAAHIGERAFNRGFGVCFGCGAGCHRAMPS